MLAPFIPPSSHQLALRRHLRSAKRSTAPRLALGTYDSVDVVVYPEQPGGRQSTLACLRSGDGRAFVDSAHYPSWRSFCAAVRWAAKSLGPGRAAF